MKPISGWIIIPLGASALTLRKKSIYIPNELTLARINTTAYLCPATKLCPARYCFAAVITNIIMLKNIAYLVAVQMRCYNFTKIRVVILRVKHGIIGVNANK